MGLKAFFSNTITWVKNTWNLMMYFRPYFSRRNHEFECLSIMQENKTAKLVSIYEDLKKTSSPKFRNEMVRFESFFSKVSEHNHKVFGINMEISKFDYNSIIESPKTFYFDFIDSFSRVAKEIPEYASFGEEYQVFLENYYDLKDNYSVICTQFDLLAEYKMHFDFSKHHYIDAKKRKEIAGFKSKLSGFSRLYYSFEKADHVDELVNKHNDDYIKANLSSPLFGSVNGRSLDLEQRRSVLTDEMATLVVAGAGSGKTLTICGKVQFLIQKEGVKPQEILLLSYSKKSADDLQEKVSKIDSGLTVGTFHKIGLDILKATENKVFAVEDQYKSIIEQYFSTEMRNRPHMLKKILSYYGLYLNVDNQEEQYDNQGEMYEDLKKSDFSTLKTQLLQLTNDSKNRETIKKEHVKSFEELAIANWYFLNGIKYTYEAPYQVDVSTPEKRQYLPDFHLDDFQIYHEHYGIGKNGKANQFKGEEAKRYLETMLWKRETHSRYQSVCLETFSYEFKDGTIFLKLEKALREKGVKFAPLSDDQIFNALNSIYEGQSFKSFINLIRTFLSLYKARFRNGDGFGQMLGSMLINDFEKQRAVLFLEIVSDVYHYYIDYLKKEEKIDFDDMILQSMDRVEASNNFKFKYIIVDEFQDISFSRMHFLKALIRHGDSKLFAVGDDWQAIYRFSGCDLNIFLKFGNYFGDTKITRITSTHRNSQELQDIAGPFIRANPEQFDKIIDSKRHLDHPIQLMYFSEKNEKFQAFLDILGEINNHDASANVLVLGRNNHDFDSIELDKRLYIDYQKSTETYTILKSFDFPSMNLQYSTVHGSKGLEADFVIIINADDSKTGFPNKMEDDKLLELVLSSKSEFKYAEERRLWYVALTRTRSYTYILVNAKKPSVFVEEIKDQCWIINEESQFSKTEGIRCPECKTGRMVLRLNEKNSNLFYGCSNYPYCTYTISESNFKYLQTDRKCPVCGDYLVQKRGKWGLFYGCNNYPRCNFTEKKEN